MDNQGWIKLHRSILESVALFGKSHDFAIFVYLITLADRRTGIARVGRLKIAKLFRIKDSNVYKVMKRLEAGNYINIKSNNQYSDVYICNYDKYQGQSNNEINNKVTTKEQQSNTIQEVRSKKVLSKDNTAYGSEAINLILKGFEDLEGHKPTDPKPRFEAFNLVRNIKKTIKEVGHKEVTDEGIARVITAYYAWLKKQEWGSNVQNLSTVRRKFEIYKSILERSTHETN